MKKEIIFIILLSVLSRFPLLLSPNMIMDGDECIVGLMAKHLMEMKELPFFFYGQNYGFSFIETSLISVSFFLTGISDFAVKVTMLLFWTFSVVFFYKTLLLIDPEKKRNAFIITAILILAPVWADSSMKARGGYHTAFYISTFLCYLQLNPKLNIKNYIYVISGFLLVLLFQSQPLWLPGILPFIFYVVLKRMNLKHMAALLAGAFAGGLLFFFLKSNLPEYWSPQVFAFDMNINGNICKLPLRIFENSTGSYYLGDMIEFSMATKLWALAFTVIIPVILVYGIYAIFIREKKFQLYYVFCISIILTLGYTLVMKEYTPRYLLPLAGFALIALFILFNNINIKIVVNLIYVFFLISGICSLISFKDFKYENQSRKDLKYLVSYLESENINYTFSKGGLLQWQVMFYSKEKVISRYLYKVDRYPAYIEDVNNAFLSGRKYAIIGLKDWIDPNNEKDAHIIKDTYFVILNPARDKLTEYGFELP